MSPRDVKGSLEDPLAIRRHAAKPETPLRASGLEELLRLLTGRTATR